MLQELEEGCDVAYGCGCGEARRKEPCMIERYLSILKKQYV